MKGDVWDDGSPNPLVVKCPICGCTDIGTMIGSGQVEYHCHNCRHAWFARGDEAGTTGPIQYARPSATAPSYSNTPPMGNVEYHGAVKGIVTIDNLPMGWVCPKCGKVYAPDVKECFTCNYNLANTKVSSQINQSSSAETHMEGVTATMGTQEKCVRQEGSFVIDKSLFPGLNLAKDSTVYAGGGGTNWCKAMEREHCNQEDGANSNTSSK